jgi:hypothetical protein
MSLIKTISFLYDQTGRSVTSGRADTQNPQTAPDCSPALRF